jgi:pimeloyl-ACP methyl ester carboxylesterase
MAEDIVELLDSLGAERAVLCGHSLGGKVVMAAALAHPARVEQLIVADIAPIEYSKAHEGWRANLTIMEAMGALPEAVLGTRGDADAALREAGVAEAGIRAFLLQSLVPEERRFRLNLHGLIAAARTGVLAGWPAPPTVTAAVEALRPLAWSALLLAMLWHPSRRQFVLGGLALSGAIALLHIVLASVPVDPRLPWACALNGAFSVVATPLASLIAHGIGIAPLLLAGAACYLVVTLAWPRSPA